MISLPSLSRWVVLFVAALRFSANGAVCRTDYPVEGCGLLTFSNNTCDWVLQNYEMIMGSCCSLSDYGNGGCRLTVDGPNSDCQVRMVGEFYPFEMVISETNNGTCPPTQYVKEVPPACKSRNTTCSLLAGDTCCNDLACRKRTDSSADDADRCLNCKKPAKPCLASTDCCQGKCRRSSAQTSTKTCRACVKVNDAPCLDDEDCCNPQATCRTKRAGSAVKVCQV
jgi:hypothetical protein